MSKKSGKAHFWKNNKQTAGKEVFYTADGPGAATGGSQPPLAGWRTDDGAAPAPTLIAGPPVPVA